MDQKWNFEAWKPSVETPGSESFSKKFLKKKALKISNLTKNIQALPYNPVYWSERASNLSALGYPELAAGDVYRSTLLIEAAVEGENTLLGQITKSNFAAHYLLGESATLETKLPPDFWNSEMEARLVKIFAETFKLLVSSLCALQDLGAANELCDYAGSKPCLVPEFLQWAVNMKAQIAIDREALNKRYENGPAWHRKEGYLEVRRYPFVPQKQLSRSAEMVKALEQEFALLSSNCSIGPGLTDDNLFKESSQPDVYGIRATADISIGDTLFIDTPTLTASNRMSSASAMGPILCENCTAFIAKDAKERVNAQCCSVVYCSPLCQRLAAEYHPAICGHDWNWLYPNSNACYMSDPRNQFTGPLWLRVLALCKHARTTPLAHPLIARLACTYNTTSNPHPRRWSFTANLSQPLRILRQLSIDIFASRAVDTWALTTVFHRLEANSLIHPAAQQNPFSSLSCGSHRHLFNHHCSPNVMAFSETGSTHTYAGARTVFVAARTVLKGEELYVAYCDVSRERLERGAQLAFVEGECRCRRCLEEKVGVWTFP